MLVFQVASLEFEVVQTITKFMKDDSFRDFIAGWLSPNFQRINSSSWNTTFRKDIRKSCEPSSRTRVYAREYSLCAGPQFSLGRDEIIFYT